MIFQRSRTIAVEQGGRKWTFRRPKGSALIGWGPSLAEMAMAADSDDARASVFPVGVEAYQEMLGTLADHLHSIEGEVAEATAAELDETLTPAEGLALFMAFFNASNATDSDLGKSERPSGSASPRTATAAH